MGRIQGLTEVFLTDDALLKSGKGYVFSTTIAFVGATAGNMVVLRDGIDANAPAKVAFALPTANGTITKTWENGKEFTTGIFVDFQGVGGGAIQAEFTYK